MPRPLEKRTAVSSRGGRQKGRSAPFNLKPFYKGANPINEGRALMTYLPKATPLNTVAIRVKFQHEFWRGTKTFKLQQPE